MSFEDERYKPPNSRIIDQRNQQSNPVASMLVLTPISFIANLIISLIVAMDIFKKASDAVFFLIGIVLLLPTLLVYGAVKLKLIERRNIQVNSLFGVNLLIIIGQLYYLNV